jgi:hypothetical protein
MLSNREEAALAIEERIRQINAASHAPDIVPVTTDISRQRFALAVLAGEHQVVIIGTERVFYCPFGQLALRALQGKTMPFFANPYPLMATTKAHARSRPVRATLCTRSG